ncbi:MAG: histidinol-phosphate transaminase [Acidimicrobiia bacterium]|jgi:histidinol-phosphate aminotransferase
MPRLRPDIAALTPYKVGRQLDDVARAHGLEPGDIVKLTANEGPEGPFPGVVEAAAVEISRSNRYPDNQCWELGQALSDELGVEFDNVLFGAGGTALLTEFATAMGGPGRNVVYARPSFVMYRFVTIWAGSEPVEVPLDAAHEIDLQAMLAAIDDNTSVVFLCNPNNPTGTIKSGEEVIGFLDSVPEDVLVVVDEAYHEFVTDPRYETAITAALQRPNVVVIRTFSKIYGLAGLRVGYAVGSAGTLTELRKAQAPLTVNRVAQAAALASLGQADELERRRAENAARRHHLQGALAERGFDTTQSQTNFVFFDLGDDIDRVTEELTSSGVLIRPMGAGWVRATIGDDRENRRLLDTLDSAV